MKLLELRSAKAKLKAWGGRVGGSGGGGGDDEWVWGVSGCGWRLEGGNLRPYMARYLLPPAYPPLPCLEDGGRVALVHQQARLLTAGAVARKHALGGGRELLRGPAAAGQRAAAAAGAPRL